MYAVWIQATAASDLAEWLVRLTDNVEVATVLGSIPASSDIVESEGRHDEAVWRKYWKKYPHL